MIHRRALDIRGGNEGCSVIQPGRTVRKYCLHSGLCSVSANAGYLTNQFLKVRELRVIISNVNAVLLQ